MTKFLQNVNISFPIIPLHVGHQRVHGDPHPGGLRQHQDVRHGRGVWGRHQHQQQAGPDSTDHGSLSRQV